MQIYSGKYLPVKSRWQNHVYVCSFISTISSSRSNGRPPGAGRLAGRQQYQCALRPPAANAPATAGASPPACTATVSAAVGVSSCGNDIPDGHAAKCRLGHPGKSPGMQRCSRPTSDVDCDCKPSGNGFKCIRACQRPVNHDYFVCKLNTYFLRGASKLYG